MTQTLTRGLGEGWSDMVALIFRMSPADTRNDPQLIGEYVTGDSNKGIRSYPYSTNRDVNPLMYSSVSGREGQVHKIGEVWAVTLLEVYWNLVDAHGFSTNLKKDVKSGKGNTLFVSFYNQRSGSYILVTIACRWHEITALQSQFCSSKRCHH